MAIAMSDWLTLKEAAKQFGVPVSRLRRFVLANLLTRGRFTPGEKRPPIYVKTSEVKTLVTDGAGALADRARGRRMASNPKKRGKP